MSNKPRVCIGITHSADLDGKCSREILYNELGAKSVLELDYGYDSSKLRNWLTGILSQYDIMVCYVVDFHLREEDAKYLVDNHVHTHTVDHHETSLPLLQKLSQEHAGWFTYTHKTGIGACQLLWEFLYTEDERSLGSLLLGAPASPDCDIPLAVQFLARYDVFDLDWNAGFEYTYNKLNPKITPVLAFQFGARIFEHELRNLVRLSTSLDQIKRVMQAGAGYLHNIYIPDVTKTVVRSAKEVTFEGVYFLVLVNQPANSLFTEFADMNRCVMSIQTKLNGFKVSMYRPRSVTGVVMNTIAVKYGGGGHPGAAGFTCTELPEELKYLV